MGKNKMGKVRRKKKRFLSDIKFGKKIAFVSVISVLSVLTIFVCSIFFTVKTADNRKIKNEKMVSDAAAYYLENAVESAVSITKTYYYSANLYDFIGTDFSGKDFDSDYAVFIQNNGWLEMKNSLMKRFTIYTQNKTIGSSELIKYLGNPEKTSYWYKEFKASGKKTAAFYDESVNSIVVVRKLDNFPLESGEAFLKIIINQELITKDLKSFKFDGALEVKCGNHVIFSEGTFDEEEEYYSVYPKSAVASVFECVSYAGKKGLAGIPEKHFFVIPLVLGLCISLLSVYYVMAEMKERISYLHDRCTDDGNRISMNHSITGRRIFYEKEKTTNDYRDLLRRKCFSDALKEQIYVFSDIKFKRKIIFVVISSMLSVLMIFLCCVYYIVRTADKEKTVSEEMMTNSAVCYLENVFESAASISKPFFYSEKLSTFIDTDYSEEDYYSSYFDFKHNNDLLEIKNALIKSIVIYTENKTIESDDLFVILDNNAKGKYWYKEYKALDKEIAAFYDGSDNSITLVRRLNNFSLKSGEAFLKITLNKDMIFDNLRSFDFDGELALKCSDGVLFSKGKKAKNVEGSYGILKSDVVSDFEFTACANSKSQTSLLHKFYFYIPVLLSVCISVFFVWLVMTDIKKRVKVLHHASASDLYNMDEAFYAGKDEIGSVYKNLLHLKNSDETLNEQLAESENENGGQHIVFDKALINAYHADACLRYMEVCRCASDELIKSSSKISLRDEMRNTEIYLDDLSRSRTDRFDYILAVDPSVDVDRAKVIPYGIAELAGYFSEYSGYGHDLVISVKEQRKYIGFRFECKNMTVNSSDILKFRAVFESNDENSSPNFEVMGRNNPCIRLKKYYGNGINLEIYSTDELDLEIFISKDQL